MTFYPMTRDQGASTEKACKSFFTRIIENKFLGAMKHLYKRVCPSVGPSTDPSVRLAIVFIGFTNARVFDFWD